MTYTVKQIAGDLGVSTQAVRNWIADNKLICKSHSYHCHYEIEEEDYVAFLKSDTEYGTRYLTNTLNLLDSCIKQRLEKSCIDKFHSLEKIPNRVAKIDEEEVLQKKTHNNEGYPDPTAYYALRNVDSVERYRRMIKSIFAIINDAGFRVDGRITFVDKKTGKVYY